MQFRSTTDEMLAARFDPEPWEDDFGNRYANISDVPDRYSAIFDPRPEFMPSRFTTRALGQLWEVTRPEPNPILVAARNDRMGKAYRTSAVAQWWLDAIGQHRRGVPFSILTDQILNRATPAQVRDARKVLTRLVNVYKED